jgi:ABC-2 type transport system ATP-binding protein
MSVKVTELTKVYGSQTAVNAITFEAKKGEVLGFLGPNGAGKSTTMKMVMGYIPPTSGHIKICGYDVFKQPKQTKSRMGYLPEHNPLYLDMYIKEYLLFMGRIHNLSGTLLRTRINEVIQLCGLEKEQHKPIHKLSKGYRQRVGLAQALLHDPEVLILDEPTTGLDPNQLIEIRGLIKELAKDKTVILSTHIMQEVKAICQRVILINQGQLVADENLASISSSRQVLKVEFQEAIDYRQLDSFGQVKVIDETHFEITWTTEKDLRPSLFELSKSNNWVILSMHVESQDMEAFFQEKTREA